MKKFVLLLTWFALLMSCLFSCHGSIEDEEIKIDQSVRYIVYCEECQFSYSIDGISENNSSSFVRSDSVVFRGVEIGYCGFMQYRIISEKGKSYVESYLNDDLINLWSGSDLSVNLFKIETGCRN